MSHHRLKLNKPVVMHISQSILAGVEAYFREIILQGKDEYHFILVTPHSSDLELFCETLSVVYIPVKMVRNISLFDDIKSVFALKRVIKMYKPDLVHLHSAKAGVLGRFVTYRLNVQSLYTPHGLSYLSFKGYKRLLFAAVETFFKRFTKAILAVSHSECQRLVTELGVDSSKVYVVANFVQMPDQAKDNITYNQEGCVFRVGTVGRITNQKNHLLMVEIANKVINEEKLDVEFHLMGGGHHEHIGTLVRAQVAKYNLDKYFKIIPWGTVSEAHHFMKELDVFILTSTFEGMPISLLEAMSMYVPSIVSKCDGCNDVIQNNVNGFSCITVDEYVEAIKQLMVNKQVYNRISKAGHKYIEDNHNARINSRKVFEVYNKLIKGHF